VSFSEVDNRIRKRPVKGRGLAAFQETLRLFEMRQILKESFLEISRI
jgi:hypothetical protein